MQRQRYVGQRLRRAEDPRLLTGRGQFVDDLQPPGLVHVAFVRSPHAHARIRHIDVQAARALPGVRAVLTPEEAARRCRPWRGVLLHYQGMKTGEQYPLALGKVRYVGEPVVAVAAVDRYTAEDACDAVRVEYEPLPAVVSPEQALAPDAPRIYEDLPDNEIYRATFTKGEVDAAFASAALVLRQEYRFGRHTGVPLEPRSLLAVYEPATRALTVWISTQVPHMMRAVLAEILGLDEQRVRVIAPDVGGSFGIKIHVYQDDIAACLLAMQLGVPVKWVADRRESFLSDIHAREERVTIEGAFDHEGHLLALRSDIVCPVGPFSAYPRSSVVEGSQVARLIPNQYRVDRYAYTLRVVAQNKVMTSQYRAVGHPLAFAAVEGLLDTAARRLGLDPAELRFRNLIQPDQFPYTSVTGNVYDSGSYVQALRLLLEQARYPELRAEQERLRAQGRLLGIGFACFVEITGPGAQFYGLGGAPISAQDATTVRIESNGKITALVGITEQGQGNHTAIAQLIADELGVTPDDVTVISGDTAAVPYGGGTWASRGMPIGGSATVLAARALREKVAQIAASLLEASAADIELVDGRAQVRGVPDRSISLRELARIVHFGARPLAAEIEPSLDATRHFTNPELWTFTNGVHLAVVEIDRETGRVALRRYVVVEDCGTVINPARVEAQVHGGVAQGLGGVLLEECRYDASGQLLTTSLLDYLVPSAGDLTDIAVYHLETPSPLTVGGFKGVGEAGVAGAPAAIQNAVNDALAPLGVAITTHPITPERVLAAIERARVPVG